jgi:hypothetical protein
LRRSSSILVRSANVARHGSRGLPQSFDPSQPACHLVPTGENAAHHFSFGILQFLLVSRDARLGSTAILTAILSERLLHPVRGLGL